MGKGGQGQSNEELIEKRELQEFSWDEIQEKTKKDDKWIVIEDEVYNITKWAERHPGGKHVISHYAGQDATDAFTAFHSDIKMVRKYMKSIHIGSVKKDQKRVNPIEEEFRELRATAEKMGLFNASNTFFIVNFLQVLVCYYAAWATLYHYGDGWVPFCISLVFFTICQAQAAFQQHDFGHLSFVRNNSKLNHIFQFIALGVFKGGSPTWWNYMHNQHHAKPNVMDKDPDVRLDALFVVGENIPVEIAKKHKKSMPYNWQNYYFFLLGPPMLFPVYFHLIVYRYVITRRVWKDLAIALIFNITLLYLFSPLIGVGWTIFYYFAFRCLDSQWFTWVAQSNHIPMQIDRDSAQPWLKLQLAATCNLEKSAFNDWFTGHLNFQIEHHLFPTMPRHNLYKIAPLVKSLCEKHNVPYIVKPLGTAFADIIRSLKNSGDIWQATYKMYHDNSH